ncbi:pectinesterase [Musa troglodytarum]|uniref:pectinesterase n=1 Tax=Musa troglodytarum TaxID=320322 RepID=A0A9E7EU32_9LILI|nr:pectinesterase [Musa troglodytarum]
MKCSLLLFLLLLLFFFIIFSSTSKLSGAASIVRTIAVDPNHKGDFTSIQEAIDSIPNNNTHWIKIHVAAGVYRFVIAGAPQNTYDGSVNIRQALAAAISGDKSSFYNCSFIGFQDTLFDRKGRHYFKDCYIEGVMDFIFGNGQSIYEGCTISLIRSAMKPGFMTAQGRGSPKDPGGFVFKSCNVTGFQETYLGRAWGAYSRVIFYRTFMSGIIIPQGWYAWNAIGHE